MLDVGCGWGSFAIHAAERHDVKVLGITLSEPQAAVAKQRVRERGLEQVTDTSAIEGAVEQVIAENAGVAEQAKTNPKAVNALLGRVMKATGGKAKPELVRELLLQRLGL